MLATNVLHNKNILKRDYVKYYYEKALKAEDPDSIIIYTDTCIRISSNFGDMKYKALAMTLKSNGFIKKHMLIEAIEVLNEAKNICSLDTKAMAVASIDLQLARVFDLNQEPEKSEEYYVKAKDSFWELKDTLRYAGTTLNLGELYRTRKWNSKALEHFVDAYWLYKEINYPMGIAYAQGNIGLVYVEEGKIDSAEILLKEAIDSLRPQGDNYAMSCYIDGLAHINMQKGKFDDAEKLSKESFELAKEFGLKEQIRDASLTLSQIYAHNEQFEEAYHYQRQYQIYRDSINNEEVIRKIANQRAEFEVAQKQQQFAKQERQYLIGGAILLSIIGIFVVVGVYIIRTNAQKRRIRLQLEKQRNELQKANDTKNKFFSILSHDLRNPLAVLNNCAEVLNMSMQTQEYEQATLLASEMDKSTTSLVQLLDNLLQWGVMQMNDVKINRSWVYVAEVVNEELLHLMPISEVKKIAINVHVSPSIRVFADRYMLAMVIRNLVSNAIKFTPLGGEINIILEQDGEAMKLSIKDNGVGFDELQFKQKLCDKELESTFGTNNEKGLGLGLQLVCHFVSTHHLKMDVNSKPGHGAVFFTHFPQSTWSMTDMPN